MIKETNIDILLKLKESHEKLKKWLEIKYIYQKYKKRII